MIKRFRYDFKSGIVADGKGDFISYAEYEVLRQKLVALTEQRDALVAENVAMKSFRKSLEDIRSSLIGGGHGYMAVSDMQAQNAVLDVVFDGFDEIDTPATDAARASLRAEGVDMAVSHLIEKFNGTGIGVPVMALEHLARQLRESKGESKL